MTQEKPVQIGVLGAGALARLRARAVFKSGIAEVAAVAARRPESAARMAAEFGARAVSPTELLAANLDALVVALPHHLQDTIVPQALDRGHHILIGGPLARTTRVGREIERRRSKAGLIVEAGYEARYERLWRRSCELLGDGALGDIVSVRSNAGFDQLTEGWYIDQELSGGMLVTHMSYAFLNPLRFLLGDPEVRGAVGTTKKVRSAGAVDPETCIALVEFPGNVPGALTASYVKPKGLVDWNVLIVGTKGALRLEPADLGGGRLDLIRPGYETITEHSDGDGFERQMGAFLQAVKRRVDSSSRDDDLLNPPLSALRDLEICEAIQEAVGGKGHTTRRSSGPSTIPR